ncbi:molecular chaperone DnaJ [Mycoplasmopsis pulmonis]|uniref:Chaperone protein DnaJ n=1 Tax=Mycoplasmopsis pulmonis (strain UAB CTIP) TaxID=272635 RepID=DNAJ_MYCPU|nr:molecular chaperone DnaJ [Mycoplasmopsis pulmonis]Q98PI9.2 RecName: Full=Chaperone protein DnaJ [Mycoplasmopsis pulmonis UAB CTIP]MDZ7293414.1 molecular chaperone DnaJ [Mycoplasmopsis pulmonis]
MNKKEDYYKILGIDKSANEKEIKKAYRKLAMEHHPDRSSSKESEAKMREINEAYEVLSNPEKKAIYDKYGHEAANNPGFNGFNAGSAGFGNFGGFSNFGGFDSIFEEFFGGSRSHSKQNSNYPYPGESYSTQVKISFLDSVHGRVISQKLDKYKDCESCNGTGARSKSDIKTCSTCNGRGSVEKLVNSLFGKIKQSVTCSTCNGLGQEITHKCPSCKGAKKIKESISQKISIPAGVISGQEVLLRGFGGPGFNGGPNGDLYIRVYVTEHPYYQRINDDIYVDFPISIVNLILEKPVVVPTPYGDEKIKIKSTFKNDQIITFKGKGFKRKNRVGDLKIRLKFEIPNFSSKVKKNLESLLSETNDSINEDFVKKVNSIK